MIVRNFSLKIILVYLTCLPQSTSQSRQRTECFLLRLIVKGLLGKRLCNVRLLVAAFTVSSALLLHRIVHIVTRVVFQPNIHCATTHQRHCVDTFLISFQKSNNELTLAYLYIQCIVSGVEQAGLRIESGCKIPSEAKRLDVGERGMNNKRENFTFSSSVTFVFHFVSHSHTLFTLMMYAATVLKGEESVDATTAHNCQISKANV